MYLDITDNLKVEYAASQELLQFRSMDVQVELYTIMPRHTFTARAPLLQGLLKKIDNKVIREFCITSVVHYLQGSFVR